MGPKETSRTMVESGFFVRSNGRVCFIENFISSLFRQLADLGQQAQGIVQGEDENLMPLDQPLDQRADPRRMTSPFAAETDCDSGHLSGGVLPWKGLGRSGGGWEDARHGHCDVATVILLDCDIARSRRPGVRSRRQQ